MKQCDRLSPYAPADRQRLTDMQNREQAVPYRQVVDSADFQLVRAKVRAMQGTPRDAVRIWKTCCWKSSLPRGCPLRFAYARYRARDWSGAEREIDAPPAENIGGRARAPAGDVPPWPRAIQRAG